MIRGRLAHWRVHYLSTCCAAAVITFALNGWSL
jgi:hypothetical protein